MNTNTNINLIHVWRIKSVVPLQHHSSKTQSRECFQVAYWVLTVTLNRQELKINSSNPWSIFEYGNKVVPGNDPKKYNISREKTWEAKMSYSITWFRSIKHHVQREGIKDLENASCPFPGSYLWWAPFSSRDQVVS